jgi:hypothetical protein
MNNLFDISKLLTLHEQAIINWYQFGVSHAEQGVYLLVEENHAFNYQLWLTEDRARRDDLGPDYVYQAKRAIDGFNQQRNNRMEAMDAWFFEHLNPEPHTVCPVNSESPGMMVDRLSILALKSYHMNVQVLREDVSLSHKQSCQSKLATINEQLRQLGVCLQELLDGIQQKQRTFRVYHQFKMYNDPSLNPQLYAAQSHK